MAAPPLLVVWAGQVGYDAALRWQEDLVARRRAGAAADTLLLLTHPPVYTAGRHADLAAHLTGLRPDIPVVRIDRGGDVTYHGPGQVVAYPILRLARRRGVRAYVTALEEAMIVTVGSYGVRAARRPGLPGVWVGRDKIGAVGVRVSEGVTKHGLALNVAPDLADYAGIVPCGIRDGGVTSLAALGVDASLEEVRQRLAGHLAALLGRRPQPAPPAVSGRPRRPAAGRGTRASAVR